MDGDGSNILYKEHPAVKQTALTLFTVLMSLSIAPLESSNYFNVASLWFAAYIILRVVWKKLIRKAEHAPFREHWTVKSVSLILSTNLTIAGIGLRERISALSVMTLWFTALVIMSIVWMQRVSSAQAFQLDPRKEEEKIK